MEREVVGALGQLKGGDFLFGSVRYFLGNAFNSAVLLDVRGGVQVYDKIHLVPFGEYVPFRHSFPLFAWIVGSEVPSDFDAGTEPVVMTLRKKPFRVAPLICFEDTVGELSRQFAQRGAELLITLTNDGWFRRSAGSRQHLANAVFRCAETKLPLVRAANTGVTCVVDPFGHVSQILENAKGSTFTEGVLFAKVPITIQPSKTFYTRHGDLFALACLVAAVLSLRSVIFTPRVIERRED
jgi:apolipoprotein N-acyltransferase